MIFKKYIFWLFAVPAFAMACNEPPVGQPEQTEPPATQKHPPVYDSFEDMEWVFNQQNDTTYVINFWATWCKPCVEEMPYFLELHNTYHGEKVKLILLSLDFKKQIENKLIPFIEKHKLEPEVIVLTDPDTNKWIPKVDEEWSGSIPATLIYNKNRRAFYEQSFESFEELNSILKSNL
jgi:thiol-disulfide isomerase/thioredoxin